MRTVALLVFALISCHTAGTVEGDPALKKTRPSQPRYTNHLAGENSPYLLSHADNPVDWYPWGQEALSKAKREDKPIFLSIGYAACHWCHVMEHESFENEAVAAVLNDNFVSIKVDREQRPDLDHIYMTFTTAMTGRGGWPMSVFLTPELKPFFAGTYFPPSDSYGRPAFMRLITEIAKSYREDKQSIVESSRNIYQQIAAGLTSNAPASPVNRELVGGAARSMMGNYDRVNGGFGSAPKFPHAVELSLFLRYYESSGESSFLEAAEKSLKAMARGGIYDHLGGGFARYSTDARWLVPHFEKMLYDNALLVTVYVEAYQLTGGELYLDVIRQTLDFILREMTDETGGFYSTLDADSEGEEGKFYVWAKSEIDSLLGGDESLLFTQYFNLTERGNFEGKNILNVDASSDRIRNEADIEDFDRYLNDCKRKLFEARSRRVRPLTDDKILTSWNGLALSAVCKGYQVTGERRYLEASVKNASFIQDELYQDGSLTHSYRRGKHQRGEFLEDYAYLIDGLLDLYETDHSGSRRWLSFAVELTDRAMSLFFDDQGSFYLRPDNQSDLIVRPKDESDGAVPAPGSVMMTNLLKLNRITGDKQYLTLAERALNGISGVLTRHPGVSTSAILALDYYINDKIEIVIVGKGQHRDQMLRELHRRFIPNRVIAVSDDGKEPLPLFEGRHSSDDEVRAYVCLNSVCRLPASTLEEFRRQLDEI